MSAHRNQKKGKKAPALPPHANAAVHRAIMKKLSAMTPDQIFATAVKSGIYTKAGKLKKLYAASSVR